MDDDFYIQEDRRDVISGDAIYAYPLTGLLCDETEIKLGHVSVLKFNRHEWWTVEKTAIIEDWEYEYMNNRPLWAYFSVPSIIANEETCIFLIDTLVEALRIFKKGYILEPRYTVCCKNDNGMSVRIPGIYRTKYIESIWGDERRAKCLKVFSTEFNEIESLYFNLLQVKQHFFISVTRILECFNVIHVPAIRSEFMVHSLMICFEIIFGSKQEFDRYKSHPNERALNLLIKKNKDEPEVKKYLLSNIYEYRNKIHHGIHVDISELRYSLDMLEYIIRIGIKEYIRLLIDLHADTSLNEHFKSLSPQLNPRVIFNKNLM